MLAVPPYSVLMSYVHKLDKAVQGKTLYPTPRGEIVPGPHAGGKFHITSGHFRSDI